MVPNHWAIPCYTMYKWWLLYPSYSVAGILQVSPDQVLPEFQPGLDSTERCRSFDPIGSFRIRLRNWRQWHHCNPAVAQELVHLRGSQGRRCVRLIDWNWHQPRKQSAYTGGWFQALWKILHVISRYFGGHEAAERPRDPLFVRAQTVFAAVRRATSLAVTTWRRNWANTIASTSSTCGFVQRNR